MKKTLRKSLTTVIVTFCMLFLLSIPVQASAFKVVSGKEITLSFFICYINPVKSLILRDFLLFRISKNGKGCQKFAPYLPPGGQTNNFKFS